MISSEIFDFLESKVEKYNSPEFIKTDPVSIPHLFSKKEDIEISGFLAATIAWGQRPVIIRNANLLLEKMGMAPYEFVMNASGRDLRKLDSFVHRTFNGSDAKFFILALRNIYEKHNGMENVFCAGLNCHNDTDSSMQNSIVHFRELFLNGKKSNRSSKHISNPAKNSSAKRINMFLRWMVRKDNSGVDFGIWKNISPALLQIPLDVHVGNVARKLKLLKRTQDDWKAVEELTSQLKKFDAKDPVKYDFALFGLGIFEKF
jgi:uncharacterized protein (TIGR02757 family)